VTAWPLPGEETVPPKARPGDWKTLIFIAGLRCEGLTAPFVIESSTGRWQLHTAATRSLIGVMRTRTDGGLDFSPVTWNAPRNDWPSQDRSVDDASGECAKETKGFDYAIFTDDVTTGTRFLKLYDERQPGRGAASDQGGVEIAGYRLFPRQIAWTLPSDDCGSRLVGETRRLSSPG
jgi:hypothetical protein